MNKYDLSTIKLNMICPYDISSLKSILTDSTVTDYRFAGRLLTFIHSVVQAFGYDCDIQTSFNSDNIYLIKVRMNNTIYVLKLNATIQHAAIDHVILKDIVYIDMKFEDLYDAAHEIQDHIEELIDNSESNIIQFKNNTFLETRYN